MELLKAIPNSLRSKLDFDKNNYRYDAIQCPSYLISDLTEPRSIRLGITGENLTKPHELFPGIELHW
jgi:hypothetical protein